MLFCNLIAKLQAFLYISFNSFCKEYTTGISMIRLLILSHFYDRSIRTIVGTMLWTEYICPKNRSQRRPGQPLRSKPRTEHSIVIKLIGVGTQLFRGNCKFETPECSKIKYLFLTYCSLAI